MEHDGVAVRKFAMAIGFMVLAVALSWTGIADRTSSKYVDDALTQAFTAYAVARGVNAVVSVLQSVSVGGSFGASFEVSPGEALDPINDLVERYAAVMELSIGSLLTQKILIGITSSQFFNILLTLGVALFLFSVLAKSQRFTRALLSAALSLVFLRFAIVLAVLANSWVDAAFLHDSIQQNVSQIQTVSDDAATRIPEAPKAQVAPTEEESGLMSSLRGGVSGLAEKAQSLMANTDVGAAKETLDQSVPGIVELMTLFILKTLLLPLLFLYGLKHVFARLWSMRNGAMSRDWHKE